MSNELKIEAGKYYRMRNGECAYVAAANKPGFHSAVGWSNDGLVRVWLPSGKFFADTNTGGDIISEWVEPERIPWEHLPKWCRWWAKNGDGQEWGIEKLPLHDGYSWITNDGKSSCVRLPKHLHSNYTGDWRNSLRERPEGV